MSRTTGCWSSRALFWGVSTGLALLTSTWLGCGPEGKATAPVSGTVTFNGQAVNGGSLTFAPVGGGTDVGSPATGQIQSDGTYVLGTYSEGDGAVIGRHRVMYSPPSGEHDEGANEHGEKGSAAAGDLVPNVSEVEVQAGSNEINIELVKNLSDEDNTVGEHDQGS